MTLVLFASGQFQNIPSPTQLLYIMCDKGHDIAAAGLAKINIKPTLLCCIPLQKHNEYEIVQARAHAASKIHNNIRRSEERENAARVATCGLR